MTPFLPSTGMAFRLSVGAVEALGGASDGTRPSRPAGGDGQAGEDAAGTGGANEGEVQAQSIQPPRVRLHQSEPVPPRRAS